MESTTSTVSLILGHGIHEEEICKSVPRNVESNGNFLVSTESLKCVEDIKCDDGGSWVNNGVRKVYLHIRNEKDCKKMKVEVVKRGGKAPDDQCWCLTRTYFFLKEAKDFRKITVSLQGNHCAVHTYSSFMFQLIHRQHWYVHKESNCPIPFHQ